jgi:hypothetical protein
MNPSGGESGPPEMELAVVLSEETDDVPEW